MNTTAQMRKPILDADGRCPECKGGWLCEYHQQETQRRWMEKQSAIRKAAIGLREIAISRTMARHETESDEAGTAQQKAERILNGCNPIPANLIISGV